MDYFFLSNTALFYGIKEQEIKFLLPCLNIREKKYKKEDIIFRAGDTITEIGIVQSGSVNIVVNFYWGDSHIFGHIGKGDIFAENYAALPQKELLCDVVAAEETEILFLDMNTLLTTCQKSCLSHHQLIYNLIQISAQKNLNLSTRMTHIAPKSIRERLLSYLSEQALKNNNTYFTIPFSRQQLADYLAVDRSALSSTLSKMQKEGLISYYKNKFILHEKR